MIYVTDHKVLVLITKAISQCSNNPEQMRGFARVSTTCKHREEMQIKVRANFKASSPTTKI